MNSENKNTASNTAWSFFKEEIVSSDEATAHETFENLAISYSGGSESDIDLILQKIRNPDYNFSKEWQKQLNRNLQAI